MKSFLSCFVFLVHAATAQALTVSLPDVAARVRSHHPALSVARLTVEEARGRQLGAGRLANPSLGADWRMQTALEPGSAVFSVDQSFPLTRRLSLEKKLSSQLVSAAELEVQDVERRLIGEAQSLAVQVLSLDRQRALRQQQTELAKKLSEFVEGRAQAGELSALDAVQTKVDAQRLIVEARRLENESRSLMGTLKPMLDLAPEETLIISGELPKLHAPAKGAGILHRADYHLAQTKVAAAQTEAELAKAGKWQDVSAGLFGGPEYQSVAGGDRQQVGFFGLRFSVPLPLWDKNEGQIAEKAATAERARLESVALSKRISSEAANARDDMLASQALALETRDKLLPLVMEQTDKLEKAYETGQTDLLTVLRAREQRLQLESTALDAERDFHLARVRYEAATGTQP